MNVIKRMVARAAAPLRRLRLYRTPQGRAVLRHRKEIIQAAEKNGFTNVRVFGSVARGDANPDSDVDLMVDFIDQKGLRTNILDQVGGKQDIEDILGVKVDFIVEKSMHNHVRASTTREFIKL